MQEHDALIEIGLENHPLNRMPKDTRFTLRKEKMEKYQKDLRLDFRKTGISFASTYPWLKAGHHQPPPETLTPRSISVRLLLTLSFSPSLLLSSSLFCRLFFFLLCTITHPLSRACVTCLLLSCLQGWVELTGNPYRPCFENSGERSCLDESHTSEIDRRPNIGPGKYISNKGSFHPRLRSN